MSESKPSCRCPGPQPFLPRSRREFLKVAGNGFGLLGLADLLSRQAASAESTSPLAPRPGHFAAKAKRCIFLFMTGGPSQMDLFDPKPLLKSAGWPAIASKLRQDSQPVSGKRPALLG